MIALLAPFALLVPVLLPLLLAGLVLLLHSTRIRSFVVLAGLAIAAVPVLPLPGLPRETRPLPWYLVGGAAVPIQLSAAGSPGSLRAGVSLLLLSGAAVALWSAMRIDLVPGLSPGAGDASARVAVAGTLLLVSGGEIVVLSVTSLVAVFGLGLALLGTFIGDVAAAPPGDVTALRGATPLLAAVLLLAMVALDGAQTAESAVLWSAGCGLLIVVSVLRTASSGAPLALHLPAQAVGLAPLAIWLLISPPGGMALHDKVFSTIAAAGLVLCLLAAANTAVGITLREVLGAQWGAQLGLVLLIAGRATPEQPGISTAAFAALANAVLSTIVLGLAAGRLALVAGTDSIAALPPPPSPLRRAGLAYAVAAASAAGVPLTLGYTLRQIASTMGGSAAIVPLLLAGSSLLLAGLAPPVAAFFRRPVWPAPDHENLDRRVGAAPLLSLLLIVLAPYRELATAGTRLFAGQVNPGAGGIVGASTPALVGTSLLQIVGALVLLAYANRSLKRGAAGPVFNGGLPLGEEPGWPLPFAGLRQILAPLSLRAWLGAGEPLATAVNALGAATLPGVRRIEHRYFLVVLVLAAILIVLFATSGLQL